MVLPGFRMGYFSQGEDESYAQALQRAWDTLRRVVDAMQPISMRLVYQVHHSRLITSSKARRYCVMGSIRRRWGLCWIMAIKAMRGVANIIVRLGCLVLRGPTLESKM